MGKADTAFINTCREILDHGTDDLGQDVRPHWSDGTPAHTYNAVGIVNRYNLQEEFPAVTLRKTALKSAMDEILWIYQKKSNNVHDLNSHVWDQWADETGSIGKAYGYQMKKRNKVPVKHGVSLNDTFDAWRLDIDHGDFVRSYYVTKELFDEASRKLAKPSSEKASHVVYLQERLDNESYIIEDASKAKDGAVDWSTAEIYMDQVNWVIYQLKNAPFSRRIMTMLWNPADAADMALEPCAYSVTFRVTEKYGTKYLNAILNQRSNDMLAAGAWNVAQYALLVMMLAQVCDMQPGELVHVIADAHIYDRHVPLVEELLKREPKPAPKVWLNPDVKDFYAFTTDDLHIEDYEVSGEQMKFEVAI